jgi:DNA repair photolyase
MADEGRPIQWFKGRGAVSNLQGRYEQDARSAFEDGWTGGSYDADGEPVDPQGRAPKTEVTPEEARSIISRNDSPDVYFNQGINPYRGCEHGCIYCFARPTHSYLGLSPGLDFETRIRAKVNAAALLRQAFRHPRYVPEMINLGAATDPYQPVEREWRISRQLLEVFREFRHPVALITKNALVERDLDLLAPMAADRMAAVYLTVTTLDHSVARTLEPRASSPMRRIQTLRRLAEAGVPVGVSVAPIIPFITDDHIEKVLEAAWDAGARSAFYAVLRLPWEVSPLFRQWLEANFPLRAERVMARIQEMRGGKDYDASWKQRMKGTGIWADLIAQRFERSARRLGFNRERIVMDYSRFERPCDSGPQMDLF